MKTVLCLVLTLPLLTSTAAWAGPLDRNQLAAEAKWILHLDAEALQATKVGAQVFEKVIDAKSARAKADLLREFGFELDWRKVQSITLYGRKIQPPGQEDPSGVVLVRTTMPVQAGLEAALARDASFFHVKRVDTAAVPVFSLNDRGYVSVTPDGTVILAKKLEAVEQARAVIEGRATSLVASVTHTGFPAPAEAGWFVALVDGLGEDAALPTNAQMFKNAQAGRFTLLEVDDRLRGTLTIRTPSAEVAQQMHQVAQGLIALLQLNAGQKPELQKLAQSATLAIADRYLTVSLQVPVTDLLQKLAGIP
jgi:hypothetical protein